MVHLEGRHQDRGLLSDLRWGKNDGLQHPYKVGLMQTDRGSMAFLQCVASRLVGQCDRSIAWKYTSPTRVHRGRRLYIALHGSAVHSCSLTGYRADSADAKPCSRSFEHAGTACGKHGFRNGSFNEFM